MPVVSYDQEMYAIRYGLEETGMNYSTKSVASFNDIFSKNQSYNTTLSGLQPSTSYYIMVMAMNSNGSTASDMLRFTTAPPREFCSVS